MKQAIYSFIALLFVFNSRAFAQEFQQAKPWMGILIETKPNEGVLVKDTVPGTPAAKAGLTAGDLIKKVDATAMTDAKQLIEYIQSRGVGNEVKVYYVRKNKNESLTLKLEAKPDDLELIRKSLVGTKMPNFSLTQVDGKTKTTSKDTAGKVVVTEFWATWCPACRDSHKDLSAFAKQYPNVKVLAVSDEEIPLLQEYDKKVKPSFQILQDGDREFIKHFMVSAIPMTVIADKTGTIIFATLGGGAYLKEALDKAIESAK